MTRVFIRSEEVEEMGSVQQQPPIRCKNHDSTICKVIKLLCLPEFRSFVPCNGFLTYFMTVLTSLDLPGQLHLVSLVQTKFGDLLGIWLGR
eukprot:5185569-Amphidinium_carterae.1